MRGEGEEFGIVERAVGIVTQHHRFEVIVEANTRNAAQVMEGVYVFAQRRRQVHRLDEVQVLPTRVAQQIAEEVHAPPPFTREVEIVDAVIHLRFRALARSQSRGTGVRGVRGRATARCSSCTTVYLPVKLSACLQFLQARSVVRFGYLASNSFKIGSNGSMMLWRGHGLGDGAARPFAARSPRRQRTGHRTGESAPSRRQSLAASTCRFAAVV